MSRRLRAISLSRKSSQLLKFWKKSSPGTPAIPDLHTEIHESALILPTEIWLEILSHFPDYALEPLSRICRRLRWIVLPLLFRSQQFFPFLETFEFRCLTWGVAEYTERLLQRLSFLSSPQLSFAIQELSISYYAPAYNRRHQVTHTPMEAVMQPLFGALPKFENLTSLILQYPVCNDTLFAALNSLRLDFFELELLPTALGDIPIPSQKEFLFNCSNSPIQQPLPLTGLSVRLIFPESLVRVGAGPTGTEIVARALACHPSELDSLKTLDLSLSFVSSPHFTGALAACPNLSSLRLRSSFKENSPVIPALPTLPQNALPHLSCYHGPAEYAPAFAHSRTLQTARLWCTHRVVGVRHPLFLHPILSLLGSGSTAAALTTLELGLTLVPASPPRDNPAILSLHSPLSHSIHISTRSILEQSLKTLRLGTQLAGAPNADSPDSDGMKELCDSARKVIHAFPGGYDPTSWRSWVVDKPWYCVEWSRAGEEVDDHEANTVLLDGTLRIEYGDHYFRGFERGEQIRPQVGAETGS
ncbi:Ubiquitin family protein [Mycena sanguinolenta]|uniref:Ubiquitin family protein n=1 Tax=Mycena sanguinolenta TaxID=230812 RepID=A0A8H6YV66_9AGAR|nr:Ubiquitin family protein [Mycena sanguinolenta]